MAASLTENETFTELSSPLSGEYLDCTFRNCDLADARLDDCVFEDCEFHGCNLSNPTLGNTSFRNVRFVGCKLLGVTFSDCRDFRFAVHFQDCRLELVDFTGWSLRKSSFRGCLLPETDFTRADLSDTDLTGCDLNRTIFHHSNLERTDFSDSFNFRLSPEGNRVRGAKFPVTGLAGLLLEYGIKVV